MLPVRIKFGSKGWVPRDEVELFEGNNRAKIRKWEQFFHGGGIGSLYGRAMGKKIP
jgi:hypothetical protein